MADINNAIRDGNHITSALFKGSDGLTYNGRIDEITGRVLVDMAGAGAGTVTSIAAGTGILATPDPITVTGTIALATSLQPAASLAGNSLKVLRVNVGETAVEYATATSGTVTSVSVTTANGVSGSVATATTTPAITLTLGAITPTSVNGLTISTTTGTLTMTNGKTLAVTNSLTLSGTDSTVMTFPTTSATIARTDAANTFTGASTASAWVLTSPTITTSIVPTSNDGAALGSTSNQFSDLFLAEGGVINWDNGDATLTQTGDLLAVAGVGTFSVTQNQNALTVASVTNTTSGTAARTSVSLSTDTSNLVTIDAFSTGYTASGTDDAASSGRLLSVGAGGFSFRASHASGTIRFYTGATQRLVINTDGSITAAAAITGSTTITANTGFMPDANDGAYLGQAGTAFSDLFLAEGGVINWDSSDVTLTQTGNILAVAGGDFRIATADVGTNADSVPTISSTNTLTNKTLTAPTINAATLNGTITLTESTSIALDPAQADQTWTGITRTGTAGATLAFGQLVYLASADSRWELADADAATTADRFLGMVVLAAAADGDPTNILLMGNIQAASQFPAMTIGSALYVGETAGAIQVAIPTGADNVIRRVGYALTADELYFNPSMDSQITVA